MTGGVKLGDELPKGHAELGGQVVQLEAADAELKRSAEQLARAGQCWQDTFDAIDDMVMAVDPDHRVRQCNRAARECFGGLALGCSPCFESGTDLVLLDMTMPVMDGRECFRRLKEMAAEAKALLSTGHALGGAAQELLDEGMVGFVQKPYVVAGFPEAAAKALGR